VTGISPAALDAIAKLVRSEIAAALAHEAIKRGRVAPAALSGRASADFLGLSKSEFYQMRKQDPTFPSPALVGRRTLYSPQDLQAWLDERRRGESD